MSMNNYPTIILGKIFDKEVVPYELVEELYDDKYEPFVYQAGESNYERPCVGLVIAESDPYCDNNETEIEIEEITEKRMMVFNFLRGCGLDVEYGEVKLYLRDNWG